jgi:microcystin-dependent protein
MSNFYHFFQLYKESPGDIIACASPVAPENYLECDGSAISRTAYAELFDAIGTFFGAGDGATTFNLPDLRGSFLRGTSDGSAADPDSSSRVSPADKATAVGDTVGSYQDMKLADHTHTQLGSRKGSSWNIYDLRYNRETSTPIDVTGEMRPVNVNVMFCVRYCL